MIPEDVIKVILQIKNDYPFFKVMNRQEAIDHIVKGKLNVSDEVLNWLKKNHVAYQNIWVEIKDRVVTRRG